MKLAIKLGGSLLTKEKESFPTNIFGIQQHAREYINLEIMQGIATELGSLIGRQGRRLELILANGAGPFGHALVKQGVDQETVHQSVSLLNRHLAAELTVSGVWADCVSPYDFCYESGKREVSKLMPPFLKILGRHMMPVSFGDCAPASKCKGYEITSADDIVVVAGELWPADRVVMLMDVMGIYTDNPKDNLNPPLGAIPRATRENPAGFSAPRKILRDFSLEARGFYAPRLARRVQGMENARFIPRAEARGLRVFHNLHARLVSKLVADHEVPTKERFIEEMLESGIKFGGGKAADVTGSIAAKAWKLYNFTFKTGIPSQLAGYQKTGDLHDAIFSKSGTMIVKKD